MIAITVQTVPFLTLFQLFESLDSDLAINSHLVFEKDINVPLSWFKDPDAPRQDAVSMTLSEFTDFAQS